MLNILNRYILRQILQTLFFAILSLCVIFVVVNFMENMDKFMDSSVPWFIIVKYYVVYLPDILKILTPISILVACLFSVGRLSNNNEITAMKTAGLGLVRLILPIATIGAILSIGQYFFNGWIVPEANIEKENISRIYLNRTKSSGPINNLAFRDSPLRNVIIQYYDPIVAKGHQVIIENYSASNTVNSLLPTQTASPNSQNNKEIQLQAVATPRLVQKIEARSITWNDTVQPGHWILQNAICRNIESTEKITVRTERELPVELNINKKQMERMNRKAEEMTFTELRDYLKILQNGGKNTRKLEVDYYSAQALPLANLIVIMFAVSFASVRRRGGLAVQITAAMVIAFVYLLFFEVMKPLGIALALPSPLIGWFANIIFILGGIICIYKTRT